MSALTLTAVAGAYASPNAKASSARERVAAVERVLRGRHLGPWTTAPDTAAAQPAVAGSSTVTVNDPTGDTEGGSAGEGDIVNASVGGTAHNRSFTVRFASPIDPAHDPRWLQSFVAFIADTDFDGFPDVFVFLGWDIDRGAITGGSESFNGSITTCFNNGTSGAKSISVTLSGICGMPTFQWQVAALFDTTPNKPIDDPQIDLAPNSGLSPVTPAHRSGYWMLGADGVGHGFCEASTFFGFAPDVVSFAPRADGTGMWMVNLLGQVFTSGRLAYYGNARLVPGEFATAIAATPSGKGYWIFTSSGGVFAFGDAGYFGDVRNLQLKGPIVAAVATPTGHGYYLVGSDGGVFAKGDAVFRGSMGGKHLNGRIVGIAATADNTGYWLVGTDGGVFSFHAPFRGSMGAKHLNQPIHGLVAYGNGYLMTATDGGVFDFSNKPFCGSLAGASPAPIVGAAAFSI